MMKKTNIIGLFVGFLGAFAGLGLLVLFNRNMLMAIPLVPRMVCMILSYWVIAVVPIIIMIVTKDQMKDLGFYREKMGKQILTGLLIGLGMSVVLTMIPYLAGYGMYFDNGSRYEFAWQYVFEFCYCILAVSAVEELVFRGFLYAKMQKIFGKEWMSILGSSVLFGLFHIFSGNILQLLMTTLMGVFFCLMRTKCKNCSTLSLIIAHGVHDAMITVFASNFLQ